MTINYQRQGWGGALSNVGSALGQALQTRGQRALTRQEKLEDIQRDQDVKKADRLRQRETFGSIQEKISALGPDANPLDHLSAISEAIGETGDLESAKAYGTLLSSIVGKKGISDVFEGKTEEELSQILQDLGMSQEMANTNAALYQSFPKGGKTRFADKIMDDLARSEGGFKFAPQEEQVTHPSGLTNNQIDLYNKNRSFDDEFIFPELDTFKEMTSREKFLTKQELGKEGSTFYDTTIQNTKSIKRSNRAIRQLTNINDTRKLPSGIAKWNVKQTGDSPGELIFTGAANKETQLFVKTVNEFVKGAKDSFGARVTNFEIDRFMQQLPSLANTEEGRRLILKQMSIISELDQLDNDSIKSVYRHYGRGKIDKIRADEITEQMKAPKEKILDEQFDRVLLEQDYWEAKQDTPLGQVAMEVDGEIIFVPQEHAPTVQSRGGRIL